MSNALVVNTPNRPVPIIIVGGGGGGGGIVAGADTQVQFNDVGAFGGDTGLTYTKATKSLKVGGQVVLGTLGDTAITRSGAAGVAEVNNGTVGTYRDLKVRNLQVQAGGRMTGAGAVPPAGTTGQHLMKNTGTDYDVSWQTPGATKVIWLTTPGSGTYTPTSGCRALYVEAVGGGGGSAGALGTAGSAAVAGGGGGGSYAAKYYATPAASYAYTVGAGGSAGAATPTAGGNGGDTTFGSAPTLTGFGATGSPLPTAGTTVVVSGSIGDGQGTLATSNGDAFIRGGTGQPGIRISGAGGGIGGYGGASMFGTSTGPSSLNFNSPGFIGTAYGGGAAGATSANATGQAGAKGGDGAIKITEFF